MLLRNTYLQFTTVLSILKYSKYTASIKNIPETSKTSEILEKPKKLELLPVYTHIITDKNHIKHYNDCNNCIYNKPAIIKEESECLKFGKKTLNAIDKINNVNFYYSKDCRNDETKCGKIGLYYISKLLK